MWERGWTGTKPEVGQTFVLSIMHSPYSTLSPSLLLGLEPNCRILVLAWAMCASSHRQTCDSQEPGFYCYHGMASVAIFLGVMI